MPKIRTIKVKSDNPSGFMIINKDDFDSDIHELSDPADAASMLNNPFEPVENTDDNVIMDTNETTKSLDDLNKDELVNLADKMGLDVDRRWSYERIRDFLKNEMDNI